MENETSAKIEKINSAMDMLQSLKNDVINEKADVIKQPKFEDDRLTKTEAAKFVGVTMPTFDKLVKAGRFKIYNIGYRKFFLKSEIIEGLKANS